MDSTLFKQPEDLSPEMLKRCRDCYRVRDLCHMREEATDPDLIVKIDRELIEYLLQLDRPVESEGRKVRLIEEMEPKLTPEEIGTLRFRREISKEVRVKLRIYCADFTRNILGT